MLLQAWRTLELLKPFFGKPPTSFLKICTPRSYRSNIKNGCRVLRFGDPNHSKSWVYCVSSYAPRTHLPSHHQRLFKLSHSKSLKRCFRRYLCQNTMTLSELWRLSASLPLPRTYTQAVLDQLHQAIKSHGQVLCGDRRLHP
jgi:hypothetical protein